MRKSIVPPSLITALLVLSQFVPLTIEGVGLIDEPAHSSKWQSSYFEGNYEGLKFWENETFSTSSEARMLSMGVDYFLYSENLSAASQANFYLMLENSKGDVTDLGLLNFDLVCEMESSILVRNSTVLKVVNLSTESTMPVSIPLTGEFECMESDNIFFQAIQIGSSVNISTFHVEDGDLSISDLNHSVSPFIGDLDDIEFIGDEMFFLSRIDEYNKTISKLNIQNSQYSNVVNLTIPFIHQSEPQQDQPDLDEIGRFFGVSDDKIIISLWKGMIDVIDVEQPSNQIRIQYGNQYIKKLDFGCDGTILFTTLESHYSNGITLGVIYNYNESRVADIFVEMWSLLVHSSIDCKIAYRFDAPWKDWMEGIHLSNYTRDPFSLLNPENLSVINSSLLGVDNSAQLIEQVKVSNNSTIDKSISVNFSFEIGPMQELVDVVFKPNSSNHRHSELIDEISRDGKFQMVLSEYDIPVPINSRNDLSFSNYQSYCNIFEDHLLDGSFELSIDDFYHGVVVMHVPIEQLVITFPNIHCITPYTTIDIITHEPIEVNVSTSDHIKYNFTDHTTFVVFDQSPNFWVRHPSEISITIKVNGEVTFFQNEEIYYGTSSLQCTDFLSKISTVNNQIENTITCLNYAWREVENNDGDSSITDQNQGNNTSTESEVVGNDSSNTGQIRNEVENQNTKDDNNNTIEPSKHLASEVFFSATTLIILLLLFGVSSKVRRT